MARQLKVFRTPIGFHDAYVAAPSQKAALEAWGSDHDLFARGIAERVDDPTLTKEPLAHPGEIIRRLRETPDEPAPRQKRAGRAKPVPAKPTAKAKPKPRPSRAALDKADAAIEALRRDQQQARDALAREEEALVKRRRALETEQARALKSVERKRDTAAAAYRRALDRWRG